MRDSNLMRLLDPQVTQPVGLVDRLCVARGADAVRSALAELATEGVAHVVVDAVADDDLRVIADACRHMPLLTGGSAVAMPLPGLMFPRARVPEPSRRPDIAQPGLVLSGSCSAMTRAQVAAFADRAPHHRLDPLILAREGPAAALDWLGGVPLAETPIIYASAEPEAVAAAQVELGTAEAGRVVENALAQLAVAARETGRRRFVVAGGESSGAVTKALGVTRLDIGAEIAPGVPWTFARSGGEPIALALKSGNFGSTGFFAEAFAVLEAT